MTNPLPIRRRKNTRGSPLLRQWRLLELLSSTPDGATVFDLADRLGVGVKTIRRDLAVFKRVGFNVDATEKAFGLKYWRIRPRFETLRGKRRQYRAIRDSLTLLIEQARTIGDRGLVVDLQKVVGKVRRKGR